MREIIKEHIGFRKQILKISISDLKKQYKGTALGIVWALVRPAITIFVFWFAIEMGLRKGSTHNDMPFFLWLIAGMIPWFYMRDNITGGANSIRRRKNLVTTIKYPVSTIPTLVSTSTLFTHLGLLLVMIIIFMLFGYMPTVYYIQLPIYILMMYMFFTSWNLFSGMICCISKDFLQLVRALVQAFFWLSGILYDPNSIEIPWIKTLLNFNPVTILVTGYRNCFIYKLWFWQVPEQLINFVIVYLVMLLLAVWAYKRLRKEIPDII